MSYDTHESLQEIIATLKYALPKLQKMLDRADKDCTTLHLPVEMITSLIARYDRGEIVEKKVKKRNSKLVK